MLDSFYKTINEHANKIDNILSGALVIAATCLSQDRLKAVGWLAGNAGAHFSTKFLAHHNVISKETKILVDEFFNSFSLVNLTGIWIKMGSPKSYWHKGAALATAFTANSLTDKLINAVYSEPTKEVAQQFDSLCVASKQLFSQALKFSLWENMNSPTEWESIVGGAASFMLRSVFTYTNSSKLMQITSEGNVDTFAEGVFNVLNDGALGAAATVLQNSAKKNEKDTSSLLGINIVPNIIRTAEFCVKLFLFKPILEAEKQLLHLAESFDFSLEKSQEIEYNSSIVDNPEQIHSSLVQPVQHSEL